jgi:hypothetical protein
LFFRLKISKAALFQDFQTGCGTNVPLALTQTKFSQEIKTVLQASVGWGDGLDQGVQAGMVGAIPRRVDRKSSGTWRWMFKTRDVHLFLAEKYPALVEDSAATAKTKLDALEERMTNWLALCKTMPMKE